MRDYLKEPLKYGETINKEEIEYYYIQLNLSRKECSKIFNCSIPKVEKALKFYNIIKDNSLVLECKKNTNLKKYGVDNPAKNNQIKHKMKETNLKLYGKAYYSQLDEFKEKLKLDYEKDPLKYEKRKEKAENTCLEKYGVKNIFQDKSRIKKAVKKKYGKDNYFQTEEFKEKSKSTCLERYNVEYTSQIPSMRQKTIKTNLERYGYPCSAKNKKVKEKAKQTCIERYGVDSPMKLSEVIRHIEDTKKKNGTFNTSKEEDYIYNLLKNKYKTVLRNEITSLYPFKCDFIIPEINIYIEYQGHWTHGKEPYDPNKKEHIELVTKWLKRSEEINFKNERKNMYKSAINTWTKRDPLKRKTAKENNLNWIEFFNLVEFKKWFEVANNG